MVWRDNRGQYVLEVIAQLGMDLVIFCSQIRTYREDSMPVRIADLRDDLFRPPIRRLLTGSDVRSAP